MTSINEQGAGEREQTGEREGKEEGGRGIVESDGMRRNMRKSEGNEEKHEE